MGGKRGQVAPAGKKTGKTSDLLRMRKEVPKPSMSDLHAMKGLIDLPDTHKNSIAKASSKKKVVYLQRFNTILEIMRKSDRTAEEQEVFNTFRGDRDSVEGARRRLIQNIHDSVRSRVDATNLAGQKATLRNSVQEMLTSIDKGNEPYLTPVHRTMLLRLAMRLGATKLVKTEALAKKAVPTRHVVAGAPIRVKFRLPDVLGRIHLVEKTKDHAVFTAKTTVPDTAVSLWIELGPGIKPEDATKAARSQAENALGKFAQGWVLLKNEPDKASGAEGEKLAKQVYGEFSKIPKPDATNPYKNKELWNNRDFTDALALLKEGELEKGLKKLGKVGELGPLFSELKNIRVIKFGRRALSDMTIEGSFTYKFGGNIARLENYLDDPNAMQLDPAPLAIYVAFAMNFLSLAGISKDTEFVGGKFVDKKTSRIEARGRAYEVKGGITGGGGIEWPWGLGTTPYKVTLHCSGGYRELETVGAQPGVKEGTPYFGILGLQLEFPGKRGKKWPVRLESAGFAQAAGFSEFNPIAYATFSVPRKEWSETTLNFYMTPIVSRLLGEVRVGVRNELELKHQLDRAAKFYMAYGPHVDYQYNAATKTHELTASGRLTFDLTENLTISGEAGYYKEFGDAVDALSGAFGMVGIHGSWEPRKRRRK